MADSTWKRMWKLFERALEHPADHREAWLERNCPDLDLREEVRRLLRAHVSGGSPLDRPPIDPEPDPVLESGTELGPWRVVELIGRGGMGEVYLVERADNAFDRRAALKLLHPGMALPDLAGRFIRERRILANLDHPDIAGLLDAGVTERGRPWLLMEAVTGEPITDYCRAHALSVSDRLGLFEQVCAAAAHAHRRLIVHRDLKPANILIRPNGDPVLLDFGIAKLLDAGADEQVTQQADTVPLTPAYASPEQIRGETAAIGMDVYALGAVLYELVAGEPPFSGNGQGRDGWLEQRRRFVVDLARRRSLPVELDWIVGRALAFDPDDRYPGADDLAEDIRRFRTHRAPRARAAGPVYRARKFARRNWRGLLAAASIAMVIGALGIELSFEAERARNAMLDSESNRRHAEQVSDFLVGLFESADATRHAGRELSAGEILDAGRERLAQQQQLPARQRINLSLALAGVYINLGDHEHALELTNQATQLARSMSRPKDLGRSLIHLGRTHQLAGEHDKALAVFERIDDLPGDAREEVEFDLHVHRGASLQRTGKLQAAGRAYRAAAGWLERHAPEDAERAAEVRLRLGAWHWATGRLEEAENHYARALQARRDQVPVPWPEVATATDAHASALYALGRLHEAEKGFREAVRIRRRVLGEAHPDTASSLSHLGAVLYDLNSDDAAAGHLQEALEIYSEVYDGDNPEMTGALNNYGLVLRRLGRTDEAVAILERALRANRAAYGDDHVNVATNLNNLGLIAEDRADWDTALGRYREAAATLRRIHGDDHPSQAYPLTNRARVLMAVGQLERAGEALDRALRLRRDRLGPDHPDTLSSRLWSAALDCLKTGHDGAGERLESVRSMRAEHFGPDSEPVREAGVLLAACTGQGEGMRAAGPLDTGFGPALERIIVRMSQTRPDPG